MPVRLCFAMIINKAQFQTLDYVGIYLRQPVFAHGQLYVALSRARKGSNVNILIVPPSCGEKGSNNTTNIVYKEILAKGNEILAIAFASVIAPVTNMLKLFRTPFAFS
ncbi:hypothetical protein LIER_30097 [Lithospermum erythrorhizon]|uniref:Uncharacterized protein n=1 Tax=Lithospermum erythrorhizon TaxID=34254 RepID=A0AAV3RSE0_LITER